MMFLLAGTFVFLFALYGLMIITLLAGLQAELRVLNKKNAEVKEVSSDG